MGTATSPCSPSVSHRPYAYCRRCKRRRGKRESSRRLIALLCEQPAQPLIPLFLAVHTHQAVPGSLTASPSDRGRGRVRVDDLGGIAHRMAHLLVFRGLDGTVKQLGSPLFPLSYLFWGWRYRPVASLSQVRRGQPTALLLCCSAGRFGCSSRLRGYCCGVVWHDVLGRKL